MLWDSTNYLLNESLIRLRFNYTRIEIEEYQDYFASGTHYNTIVGGFQNKVTFAPGIAWKISHKKLSVNLGFELPINFDGEFKMTFVTTESDSLTGQLMNDSFGNQQIPKGLSFGLGAIFGFNYFLTPYFSVGSEVSPSLLYSKRGGMTSGNFYSTTPAPGSTTSFTTNDKMERITFMENRFSIGLSFWL